MNGQTRYDCEALAQTLRTCISTLGQEIEERAQELAEDRVRKAAAYAQECLDVAERAVAAAASNHQTSKELLALTDRFQGRLDQLSTTLTAPQGTSRV
ncbi:hypothetical protein AB0B45_20285 [Nonomuraea sp. NPDC049152]|uniref:hypothetical protein n=1 Tax=Nonomuraea sp. NPDC049152 TaxID=3154350 RepID=UPI0033FA1AB2